MSLSMQGMPISGGAETAQQLALACPMVPEIYQQQSEWCWAACIAMVLNSLGQEVDKCQIVNRQFNQTTCCNDPNSDACNQPLQVAEIERAYNAWGLSAQFVGAPVTFASLQGETGASRPVQVGFSWSGPVGGFHVALITCTSINEYGELVQVNDPRYNSGLVYYQNLESAYGLGRWTWTWASIARL